MCKELGYSEEEFLFMNIWDIVPEIYLDQYRKRLTKILEGQSLGESAEYAVRGKDGKIHFVEVLSAPHYSGKDIIGFRGIARDITARKQAEERIQRQLEHLTALSTIDRVIAANFDLKLSLSEILTHVTIELGIDAADILILNSNSQMLEYGAGRAAQEHQLVQIPNLRHEPDNLLLTTQLTGEDFVCYFGVPLITKGQVKGVLEVFHRSHLEPDAEWFDFLNTLAGQTALAIENATLFESQQRSNSELTLAYDATIEGWSRALDLRDKETEGHTQRVTEMTVKLARGFGLHDAELVQVRWGALLHDIGKMGVPDGILHKPGPLTDKEWITMKQHPTFAHEMLAPIRYLRPALDIPYCHHEKWDGSGYPNGLKGDQIPLVARIFAVVDVWDALNSDRPYRPAWTDEKVREYISASSGTHFDPQVVEVFMQLLYLLTNHW
jgi:PAS domain S-box-containing protein/putative nucleotidyltransferase with HDIG domain